MRFLFLLLLVFSFRLSPGQQPSIFAKIHQQPFDIIQIGDIHAGGSTGAFSRTNLFIPTINEIINSNGILWNCPLVISCGDNYEGLDPESGNSTNVTATILTNQLLRLRAAGMSVLACPGNHDCDSVSDTGFFTNYFFWMTNDPAFVAFRTNRDVRDVVFCTTNSGIKQVFVTYRWEGDESADVLGSPSNVVARYASANAWASSKAQQFSNHLFNPVMHYLLRSDGAPAFTDTVIGGYTNIGPGLAGWTNCFSNQPNSFIAFSGHVRQTAYTQSQLRCFDGHTMYAFKWNTQSFQDVPYAPNFPGNGGAFLVYHFDPDTETVRVRIYHTPYHAFMTNGQSAAVTNVDYTFSWRGIP